MLNRERGQNVRTELVKGNRTAKNLTTQWSNPGAGIALPDSKMVRLATELARDTSPPYLFNHAARTFLFGSLIGNASNLEFDSEILYLACILHDLGLTERFLQLFGWRSPF